MEVIEAGVRAYGLIEPQIYEAASVVYSARRSDEAAQAVWEDRMAFLRGNIQRVMQRLEGEGMLADGWTVEEATDFTWALLSTNTYEFLWWSGDGP